MSAPGADPTGQSSIQIGAGIGSNFSANQHVIVTTLDHAPIIIAEAKEEEYRQHLAWERESDRYRVTRDRASAIDDLVNNHEKAGEIRDFVSKVESAPAVPTATRRKARWANTYADHLDPLTDFRLKRMDVEPTSSLYNSAASILYVRNDC